MFHLGPLGGLWLAVHEVGLRVKEQLLHCDIVTDLDQFPLVLLA